MVRLKDRGFTQSPSKFCLSLSKLFLLSKLSLIFIRWICEENQKDLGKISLGISGYDHQLNNINVNISVLTMRKHAPIMTAFILTSRSMGNWIPKLSESVNASRRSPVHCLLILPILLTSSIVRICTETVHREGKR